MSKICSNCGTDKSIQTWTNKDGTIVMTNHWNNDGQGGWLCRNCRAKIVDNPKWNPVHNPVYRPIYNPRRIVFEGKQRQVSYVPRIGVCNWCRAIVGEINAQVDKLCKQTHMNHESYHIEDLLKDTIELCVRCHRAYHIELEMKEK